MARGSYKARPAGAAIPAEDAQRAQDREPPVQRIIRSSATYAARVRWPVVAPNRPGT